MVLEYDILGGVSLLWPININSTCPVGFTLYLYSLCRYLVTNMHKKQHEPVPKFHFQNPSQPWSGTPLNERSIISATSNLITSYLATGNWKFLLYRLRLEIQVIVLYNNKLCMSALLWQINTNLSLSTHFYWTIIC